ncbi:MAG: DUF5320 domain-containing protein [Methanothrix sp.]|jgi:hypothetical protein|uniref:DUF5320 domain-containing protein n=1 Tax=Methanothrix sp. TaxID=90426 RepID=UPI001BD42C72|nr:DUF5320 domain-containing protein [Methanothrix sp.]MBK7385227.1 DUF5320 domain-containing protein [Methanothrix sp.]HPW73299.1 DUF5320 domain-containing protein [Methanothrix sp.]
MPWGDCTGPWWTGPRGNRAAGYYNPWCRRAAGFGMGYGRGYGRGFGYIPDEPFRQPTPEEKRDYLEAVARNLEEELKAVRAQIENLQP